MSANLLEVWNKLKRINELSRVALQDKDLPVFPKSVLHESLAVSPAIPIGGGNAIHLKAAGTTELTVFSCVPQGGGKDPDGVLRPRGLKSEPQAPPAIVDAPSSPGEQYWVKFAIESKVDESVSEPFLRLGLDASEALRFCDYRLHPKAVLLGDCVQGDMKEARFAFDLADIRALKPGEAISLGVTGSIAASATMSWADTFTESLGFLASSLGITGGLGVKVDSGITFSAKLTITDDFRVTFAGLDGDRVRVAISKAKTKKLHGDARLSISARVDCDESNVQRLLESLIGRGYSELSPQVQKKISGEILDRAKNKVSAGFEYEYGRVSTDAVLFQGTMKKMALTNDARLSFLRGNLEAVIAQVRQQPPTITLEQYLRRDTLTQENAWGFSLEIGHWKLIGKDRAAFTRETSLDIGDHKKVAYAGLRSYDRNHFHWSTDYKADMDHFYTVSAAEPPVSEFQLGFHLLISQEGKVKEETIESWMDWVRLWKVMEGNGEKELQKDLESVRGEKVHLTFQLLLDKTAVDAILRIGQAPQFPHFSWALAAALPWVGKLAQRTDIQRRREVYQPIWGDYLMSEAGLGENPGNTVAAWLRKHGYHDATLLGYEGDASSEDTFKGIVASIDGNSPGDGSRTIMDRVKKFTEGLEALSRKQDEPHSKVIPEAFENMTGMGSQSFLVRALGVYLLDLAEERGVLAETARSLTIEDGTKAGKSWVYGNGVRA